MKKIFLRQRVSRLGHKFEAFEIPQELESYMADLQTELGKSEAEWNLFAGGKRQIELAKELELCINPDTDAIENDPDFWDFSGSATTRKTSGIALNRLVKHLPGLIGGLRILYFQQHSYGRSYRLFSRRLFS